MLVSLQTIATNVLASVAILGDTPGEYSSVPESGKGGTAAPHFSQRAAAAPAPPRTSSRTDPLLVHIGACLSQISRCGELGMQAIKVVVVGDGAVGKTCTCSPAFVARGSTHPSQACSSPSRRTVRRHLLTIVFEFATVHL